MPQPQTDPSDVERARRQRIIQLREEVEAAEHEEDDCPQTS